MKKIIKKVLMESLKDKRLQQAYVYFNNYLNMLEEVVDKDGNIYLFDHDSELAKVIIEKYNLRCKFSRFIWVELSKEFSLEDNEIKSLITNWVEDTYKLKDVYTEDMAWWKFPYKKI